MILGDTFTAGLGVGPQVTSVSHKGELSFHLTLRKLSIHMPFHVTGPPPSHDHPNPFSISLRFRGACRCGQASSSHGQYVLHLGEEEGAGLGFCWRGEGAGCLEFLICLRWV